MIISLEKGYNDIEFYRPKSHYHRIDKITLDKEVSLTLTKFSPKGFVSPLIINHTGLDLSRYSHMFIAYRDCRTNLSISASENCVITIYVKYDHDEEQRDQEYREKEEERKRQVEEHYTHHGGIRYDNHILHFNNDYTVHPDDQIFAMQRPESIPVDAGSRYIVIRDGQSILTGIEVISGDITEIEIFICGHYFDKLITKQGSNPLRHYLLLPIMFYVDVSVYPNAKGVIRYEYKYVPSAIVKRLQQGDVIYDGYYYSSGIGPRPLIMV